MKLNDFSKNTKVKINPDQFESYKKGLKSTSKQTKRWLSDIEKQIGKTGIINGAGCNVATVIFENSYMLNIPKILLIII